MGHIAARVADIRRLHSWVKVIVQLCIEVSSTLYASLLSKLA